MTNTLIRKFLFVALFSFASPFAQVAQAERDGDIDALRACASQWGKTPFGEITSKTPYRTLNTKVRVLGIGGETVDDGKTDSPELILIKPSVNVLTKTTYKLLNPNGYYCFKAKVTVLGSSVIQVDCKARVAAESGTEVLANNKDGTDQGVTVLGKSRIERLNCK